MLAWQTRKLLEPGRGDHTVYVRPEMVVEIAFNDMQVSPQCPGGLTLRFARVKRHRSGQGAKPATSQLCKRYIGSLRDASRRSDKLRVLRARGVTDKGRIRPTNEDSFAVDEALSLCVVADGIGGHNAGEVAARLAVDVIVDFVGAAWSKLGEEPQSSSPFGYEPSLSEAGNLLRTAIHLANMQIFDAAATSDDLAGMGTTIVAAFVMADRLSVGHVGDSRLYVSANGRLRQVTHDDSWTARMLARDPATDPVALQHHPMRNALTNVVGARSTTDVHVVEERLTGGEVLLLCTDGVHAALDVRRLQQLLVEEVDPAEVAATIVRAAIVRGSRDNCTAVVARYLPNSTDRSKPNTTDMG